MFPERPKVTSKKEFIDLIFDLLDHNDAVEWENDTVYDYLHAMAAWLEDADGFYSNIGEKCDTSKASWQLFADMLQEAAGSSDLEGPPGP